MSGATQTVRGKTGSLARLLGGIAAIGLILTLAGCGGGAGTEANPQRSGSGGTGDGGVAANADVQNFRIHLWENIRSNNRCAQCHFAPSSEGGTSPDFANTSDVNLAYAAAAPLVNLDDPGSSRLVTKVREPHNCWDSNPEVCAQQLTTWIEAWALANAAAAAGPRELALTPPAIHEVGENKAFPADPGAFETLIWNPLLRTYCMECHAEDGVRMQQAPYFASSDLAVAYDAAKPKINLDIPENSRFVRKLIDEQHNCWDASVSGDDCAASGAEMLAAIQAFANGVPDVQLPTDTIASKALVLRRDGIVATLGVRYDDNVIAKWEFKEGEGSTVARDTSGVGPLDLTLSGNYQWFGGWGVQFGAPIIDPDTMQITTAAGRAQGSTTQSAKIANLVNLTGEYSVEAWVIPANVVQEERSIVAYSGGSMSRNFTLGQTMYNYDYYHRSTTAGQDGTVAFSTNANDEDLQAALQHVVLTFDPVNGRRIYVNGQFTDDVDPDAAGSLSNWDNDFALVLGADPSGQNNWEGVIRLLAIHNRALTQEQIQQNFDVGVGERFYLLFNIGEHIDPNPGGDLRQHYIMFEAAQFDTYSYLFSAPTFVSLEDGYVPNGITLEGMRIGINGGEPEIGQAYKTLSTSLTANNQAVSPVGTVIAVEQGPDSDEFFLSFERLGDEVDVRTETDRLVGPTNPTVVEASLIGLRTFDEINATMAGLTGVDPLDSDVVATFATIKQQLPSVELAEGFLSSHQVGISQLAIEYCNELVETPALSSAFFGTIPNFPNATGRDQVISALYDHMIDDMAAPTNLSTAPTQGEVGTELTDLYNILTASCGGSCDAARTRTVVKSMCAATLGSAAMLIQ
jgi:hypothetical protein